MNLLAGPIFWAKRACTCNTEHTRRAAGWTSQRNQKPLCRGEDHPSFHLCHFCHHQPIFFSQTFHNQDTTSVINSSSYKKSHNFPNSFISLESRHPLCFVQNTSISGNSVNIHSCLQSQLHESAILQVTTMMNMNCLCEQFSKQQNQISLSGG